MTPVDMRSIRNAAPPSGFDYSLRSDAIIVNALCTPVLLVAGVMPYLGVLLGTLAWLGVYAYAAECLHAALQGVDEPPRVRGIASSPAVVGNLFAQGVFLAGVPIVASIGGLAAGGAVLLLSALWLPAALLATHLRHSAVAGLNPTVCLSTARSLGSGYRPLVVTSAVVGVFASVPRLVAFSSVGPGAQAVVHLLMNFIAVAATLAMYYSIGVAGRAVAEEFGFEAARAVPAPPRRDPDCALLDEVDRLMTSGDVEGADRQLASALRMGGAAVQRRYRARLHAASDTRSLVDHARSFVGQLLALGEIDEALKVSHESLVDDRHFVPNEAADCARLIELASEKGLEVDALQLARNACRSYSSKRRPVAAIRGIAAKMRSIGSPEGRAWEDLLSSAEPTRIQ